MKLRNAPTLGLIWYPCKGRQAIGRCFMALKLEVGNLCSPVDRCRRFCNLGVSVGDDDSLLYVLLWTESWGRVGRIHLETLGPQRNKARTILYCKIMA
jgi:hypothetical protein